MLKLPQSLASPGCSKEDWRSVQCVPMNEWIKAHDQLRSLWNVPDIVYIGGVGVGKDDIFKMS